VRKRLLLISLALVLGAVLYSFLSGNQSYLLLAVGPYVLETSVWTAILIVIVVAFLLRLLQKAYRLLFVPGNWVAFHSERREKKFRSQTFQGVIDYLEGNWPRAVSNFKKPARQSDIPAVNYLGAAAASYQLGDFKAVKQLLDQAESEGGDPFSANLLRVRLYLQERDFNKALNLVERLHRQSPSHPSVLRLLASARKGIRDWNGLESLLPDLKRHKVLSPAEMNELEVEIYWHILSEFPGKERMNMSVADLQHTLDRLWDRLPRHLQQNTRLMVKYLEKLQKVNRSERAESRLRRYLNKHWDDQLAALYAEIDGNASRQLSAAELWLKTQPNNPVLLRTLARLCVRQQLWGKAKAYYQQSLSCGAEPQTYLEMAELLQRLKEGSASTEFYRKGLTAAVQAGQST
jgi:HemY protein